jgi:hypothetical protein
MGEGLALRLAPFLLEVRLRIRLRLRAGPSAAGSSLDVYRVALEDPCNCNDRYNCMFWNKVHTRVHGSGSGSGSVGVGVGVSGSVGV